MTLAESLSAAVTMPCAKVTYRSGNGLALLTLTNPPANELRARVCERDVAFVLTFCNL